jgi:hypothetical protein
MDWFKKEEDGKKIRIAMRSFTLTNNSGTDKTTNQIDKLLYVLLKFIPLVVDHVLRIDLQHGDDDHAPSAVAKPLSMMELLTNPICSFEFWCLQQFLLLPLIIGVAKV